MNILVLAKNKPDTNTQFIDASGEAFFKKQAKNNVMSDQHIQHIMEVFDQKQNVPHVAASVSHQTIAANDYNLSVSAYVEPRDTREVIDITKLNAEIKATVHKIDQLRDGIDAIIAELEA